MSSIELTNGSATLTARADYLLVVEHGTLSTSEEANRYTSELELAAHRFQLKRLLVDARSETAETAGGGAARTAMWGWIRSQRSFEMIGYVLVDQMMIARVNMTALSERLPVRAFESVADGHRWLARVRRSSTAIPAAQASAMLRTPTPEAPATRSSTVTGRHLRPPSASTTQEVEAIADDTKLRTPTPSETARTAVKIAALDEAAADRHLGRRR